MFAAVIRRVITDCKAWTLLAVKVDVVPQAGLYLFSCAATGLTGNPYTVLP